MKVTKKLPNPEGVAAGGTATFRIPTGLRIHELVLKYAYNATTQNVGHFTEIRIFCNSQIIQRFTGTQRDKMNQFDGIDASTGILIIPFDRYNLISKQGMEETAINTGVADEQGRIIKTMYMEIDIASGATIGASDLSLYAVQSDAIPGGPGTIPYIRLEQRTAAGADTDFQISDLVNPGVNAPDKVALTRVTFIPSSGSINNLKIDRNTYTVFERTNTMNRVLQQAGVRVPQAGYFTIDTSEKGYAGEPVELFGITDFRYRLDVSAGMTIAILSEYMGVLQL